MILWIKFVLPGRKLEHKLKALVNIPSLGTPLWPYEAALTGRPAVLPEMTAEVFVMRGDKRRQVSNAIRDKVVELDAFWSPVFKIYENVKVIFQK